MSKDYGETMCVSLRGRRLFKKGTPVLYKPLDVPLSHSLISLTGREGVVLRDVKNFKDEVQIRLLDDNCIWYVPNESLIPIYSKMRDLQVGDIVFYNPPAETHSGLTVSAKNHLGCRASVVTTLSKRIATIEFDDHERFSAPFEYLLHESLKEMPVDHSNREYPARNTIGEIDYSKPFYIIFCPACQNVTVVQGEAEAKQKAEELTEKTGNRHILLGTMSSCSPVANVKWDVIK